MHILWNVKDFLCELESGIEGTNSDFLLWLMSYCPKRKALEGVGCKGLQEKQDVGQPCFANSHDNLDPNHYAGMLFTERLLSLSLSGVQVSVGSYSCSCPKNTNIRHHFSTCTSNNKKRS